MWLDNDQSKYLNQWKYVEVGRYVPDLDRVIRDQTGPKGNRLPVILEWSEVDGYREQHKNLGIYTSIWRYNNRNIDHATRLGNLYFDFDSTDLSEAQEDAVKLVDYLLGIVSGTAIRMYFTGAKGFSIECEVVPFGITPSNELPRLFRYIAGELRDKLSLATIDFSVYDARRMWRLPNSRHQKSGLYKVPLARESLSTSIEDILLWANSPREEIIPPQTFDIKANEWYREWTYKQEASKDISLEERIARFNKHGSTLISKIDEQDMELVFDPISLFTNCKAVRDLWDKAEFEHHLLHEERLFLCSILSYNDEAVEYLHHILALCDDYSPEKSTAHINDWIRRREMGIGGRPYSCARANAGGVGCGECHLEPKERRERVGNHWVNTGELAEASPVRFAYHKRKSQTPSQHVTISQEAINFI